METQNLKWVITISKLYKKWLKKYQEQLNIKMVCLSNSITRRTSCMIKLTDLFQKLEKITKNKSIKLKLNHPQSKLNQNHWFKFHQKELKMEMPEIKGKIKKLRVWICQLQVWWINLWTKLRLFSNQGFKWRKKPNLRRRPHSSQSRGKTSIKSKITQGRERNRSRRQHRLMEEWGRLRTKCKIQWIWTLKKLLSR